MIKKFVTISLVLAFALTLGACGKKGDVNPPKSNGSLVSE